MSSRQAGAGITHHRHFQPLRAGGAFHAQARAQHGIQNNCGVFGGPGDGAGAVHGIGIGQSTFHRQDVGCHQYTTATCGCGGQPYRSRSIRPNRKKRHAHGHRNARPRGRTAREARLVPRIARGRIGQIEVLRTGALTIFPGGKLADKRRASSAQHGDYGRIRLRDTPGVQARIGRTG
jgi:hypothetical protein